MTIEETDAEKCLLEHGYVKPCQQDRGHSGDCDKETVGLVRKTGDVAAVAHATVPGVQITLTARDANLLQNTLENLETIMYAAFRDNALVPYASNPLHLAEQIAALYDVLQSNSAEHPVPIDTPAVLGVPRQPGALDPHMHYTVYQEIGQQDSNSLTGRYIWERNGEMQLTPAQFNAYHIPRDRNDFQLGIQTRCRLLLVSSTGKIIRERYGA